MHYASQIDDVKRFCCAPIPNSRCVHGMDRTFSLGKFCVRVTTFKYLDAVRISGTVLPALECHHSDVREFLPPLTTAVVFNVLIF